MDFNMYFYFMETIDALLNKISYPKLKDPFPSKKQMDLAYRAAFRAPDHGWLRPWRFIEVTNSGREKLGNLNHDEYGQMFLKQL